MRAFAQAWPETSSGSLFVPQAVTQMPWGHIRLLLDKFDDNDTRLWWRIELPRSPRSLQSMRADTLPDRAAQAAPRPGGRSERVRLAMLDAAADSTS